MTIRTMDFDRLAASAPLNKDAAIARDGSGEHYEAPKTYLGIHSDVPLALRAIPLGSIDLTGTAVGRLQVLGLLDEPGGRKFGARWVVRCVCGRYTTRTAKAIRNPLNTDDMCFECDRTNILRKRACPSMMERNA